ncbi:MAG: hypothetical protein AAB650_02880 [Patescibacteria group bacterium]
MGHVDYACVSGIHGGVARCRKSIVKEDLHCADHDELSPLAPRPDVVLLKVNLNDRWDAAFGKVGIPKLDRSPRRAVQLAAEHRERAEQLGRDPFAIREAREGLTSDPESADSGCPVFGKGGLQSVDIRGLVTELRAAGFRLTGFHRLARLWKPPVRLVMQFTKTGESLNQFPWDLFRQFTATCFGQVDVWANDRDNRGLVVHTVNCGKRDEQAKPVTLRFDGGDWETHII